MRKILIILLYICWLGKIFGEGAFPLPEVNKPELSTPEAGRNLVKIFKNEFINDASLNLFIISKDIAIPGPGALSINLTRGYSARLWDTKKSDDIINDFANYVWGNKNFLPNVEWGIAIAFGIGNGVTTNFSYYMNTLSQDTEKRKDYKRILHISQEMTTQEAFKKYSERLLGQNWDLFINNFNRVYISHNYSENYSDAYSLGLSNPIYIKGRWKHSLCFPTPQGGNLQFSRIGTNQNYYKVSSSFGPSYSGDHPEMGEVGDYTPGVFKNNSTTISFGQKQYDASYNGTNCILKTINGVVYVFSDIVSVTNDRQDLLGHLDFEYVKKVAFLKEIRDQYENKIVISYNDASSGSIRNIQLIVSGSVFQTIEFEYSDGLVSKVIWKKNNQILKSVTYAYNSNQLSSVTDPQGRSVQYSYHANENFGGRIQKVTYPNSSYTTYEYNCSDMNDTSDKAANSVVKKMLLPAEEICISKQIRFNVDPESKQVSGSITRNFKRQIDVKGTIVNRDSLVRDEVNKYEILRSVTTITEPLYKLETKTITYEFDKNLRKTFSETPIKKQGAYTLNKCVEYIYGSGLIIPSSIETSIKLDVNTIRVSLVSNFFDKYNAVTNSTISISNDTIPFIRTGIQYTTISKSFDGIEHILHLPVKVTKKNSSGNIFQQSEVEYNEYGSITVLKQQLKTNESPQKIKVFSYVSGQPWLVEQVESVFDSDKSIFVKLGYDGHPWGLLPTSYITSGGGISFTILAGYDDMGRMVSTTDENGNTTKASYDFSDRIIKIEQPDNTTLLYTYNDSLNKVTTEIQTNGGSMNHKYQVFDGYGRLLKEWAEGADGTKTPEKIWTLDHRGLVKYQTVKKGDLSRSIYFEYDIAGRPVLKVFSDNSKITMKYDGYDFTGGVNQGFVSSEIVNQLGQTVRTFKDFLGRTVKIEREKGESKYTTLIDYNIHNKPVRQVWNPGTSQKLSLFTYDYLGRLVTARYSYDGSTGESGKYSVQNEYNLAGKIIKKTLKNGTEITTKYDGIGRPLRVKYGSGSTDYIAYGYDSGDNAQNKLTGVTNAFSSVSYEYEKVNRLKSFTRRITAGGINKEFKISYTYDGAGRIASVTQPGKGNKKYTFYNNYNDIGQYTKLLNGTTPLAAYTYDGLGQLSKIATYNNTFSTSYGYDRMGRITSISGLQSTGSKQLFLEKYTYDSIGNRLTTTYQNGATERYEYSPVLSMLSKVHYPQLGNRTMTYSYDKRQNRTSWIHLFGRFDYSYDSVTGKLTNCIINGTRSGNKIFTSYSYDKMGNTTARKLQRYGKVIKDETFSYNLQNQLTNLQVVRSQGSRCFTNISSYAYDHTGLRVMQQTSSSKTNSKTFYLYGAQSQRLLAEMDRTGEITRVYIYGLGSVGYIDQKDSKIYLYNKDVLASPRVITDQTGNVVYSSKTGPFGNIEHLRRKKGVKQNFTGKMLDEQNGLYYFHARYYDPAIGRFLSVDPAQDGDNWWVYCGNKPLVHIDPNGKEPVRVYSGTIEQFIKYFNTGTKSRLGIKKGYAAISALMYLGKMKSFPPRPAVTPPFNHAKGRYVYTKKYGWVDMVHFLFYAGQAMNYKLNYTWMNPINQAVKMGYRQEFFDPKRSRYSYEDLPSDFLGAVFATRYFNHKSKLTLGQQITKFFKERLGATIPERAPNWLLMPFFDHNGSPSWINKTINPMFTTDNEGGKK